VGKVRKGSGGRVQRRNGSRGMSATPASAGKVLYCERCGLTDHRTIREVRQCYGHDVVVGRDFRWVRP